MNDSDFDDALRQRHADALAHLSTWSRAQLRNRLAASTTPPRKVAGHRMAWTAATACAVLSALVIGLQLRPQPALTSQSTTPATVVDDIRDDDTPYAALDENPDLYLWLASSDAVTLASE